MQRIPKRLAWGFIDEFKSNVRQEVMAVLPLLYTPGSLLLNLKVASPIHSVNKDNLFLSPVVYCIDVDYISAG